MIKKNTALKTFANTVAPKLSAIAEPMVTLPGGGTMKLSDYMAAVNAATGIASVAKPKPAPVVALPVSQPVDFVAKAKETACFAAARQACRAAGLAYDAKTNPTGGKYGPNREAYWNCFWTGYNTEAKKIGIPVRSKPAK